MKCLRYRSQTGQALAEFALVLPVLALILFGLTEIGLVLNNEVSVVSASRNGARIAASTSGAQAQVNTAVTDSATSLIRCAPATPTVSGSLTTGWTVTASCTYSPITPLTSLLGFFGGSGGGSYTLQAQSTMKDSYCTPPGCH